MKTSLFRFVSASFALLALATSSYGDLYFQVTQYGSGWAYEIGTVAIDNPTQSHAYDVTYPASDLSMPFTDFNGAAYFMTTVDSSAAKGLYYIGYFPGGATCYVSIN